MIISLFFSTLLFFMLLAIILGAPFVPSKPASSQKMIELLKLAPGTTFYDLGSGDGRLLILAAQKGVQAYGIELNLHLVIYSKIRALLAGVGGRVHVRWGNYWWISLQHADAVAVYALPHLTTGLARKFKKELQPGTRIVSNTFAFRELTLVKKEADGKNFIYLYTV